MGRDRTCPGYAGVNVMKRLTSSEEQDEGVYHCSLRTTLWILEEAGETRERRDQLTHPAYQKPELLATAPNQLRSWDITKLNTPWIGTLVGTETRKFQLVRKLVIRAWMK